MKAMVAAAALAAALGVADARAAEWTSLFNGKTLEGWSVDPAHAANFSVKDGAIRADGASGWLKSDRTYSNFRLRFQFRFLSPDGAANGGVFMRTPANTNFARGWPGNSFEFEVRDMTTSRELSPPWMGQFLRLGSAPEGWGSFDSARASKAYRKTGQWQTGEIIADGDRLVGIINGVRVSSADNVRNLEGYIGLQAEVGTLEYRAVEIMQIEPSVLAAPEMLFNGSSLAGWQALGPAATNAFTLGPDGLQIAGGGGWLKSDGLFGDFKLRVEFRLTSNDAESAIFIRTPAKTTYGSGWPEGGVEVNLRRNSNARPTTAVGDPRWLGAIIRRGQSQGPSFMNSQAILDVHRTAGSWQVAEIEVAGSTVDVRIDGVEVSRAENLTPGAGYLGFKSSKGIVDIRSVTISRSVASAAR